MANYIVPIIIGVVAIFIGVQNLRGNISSLHKYHRKRVSEKDILPFGRLVGIGTILVGDAVILKACFEFAADSTGNPIYSTIGSILLTLCFVVGFSFILFAMFKYNKGIF